MNYVIVSLKIRMELFSSFSKDIEVPSQWSQVATDILAQKYLRKAGVPQPDGSLGSETSVKQAVHRLANCWRKWGGRRIF